MLVEDDYPDLSYASFFSDYEYPVRLDTTAQGFYLDKLKEVYELWHYMSIPCQKAQPETTSLCLAKVRQEGKLHYYITEHTIGRCPWKKVAK